ncbi:HD-GYP domain-containing protein [Clostridium sp. LBM24168]
MRLEFIDRVTENEILGKSIFTRDGRILLRAGVKLTNDYINKLKKFGALYIYVEDERLSDVEVEDEDLMQLKQTSMKSMASVCTNLYNGETKSLKDSIKTVENLVDYIIDIGDVNKSLYDIQTYDNYTFVHSLDTCIMSSFLGITAGIDKGHLEELGVGAILHDIGKTKVPINILNKKGKLTEEEFSEIKNHPIYGVDMLKNNYSIPDSAIKVVGQHHERVDGRGYPNRLTEKQITKFARLVCICDVYDAVSNDRCYRKKFSPNEAYELILSGSGSIFDRNLVMDFKSTFAIYPLGCHVKLSNNEDGYVIKQNEGFPDRPIIRVFNESSAKDGDYHEIDLLSNIKITILGIA